MKKLKQQDRLRSNLLPAKGYIRQSALIPAIIPISSATLWRWCQAGHFPKPVKLGPSITAWSVDSIRKWMDARAHEEGQL